MSMDDYSFSGSSVLGAVCAVILAIVGFFREWRKYRADGKVELKDRIDALQAALNLALEEGRITDAGRLQKELDELWNKYRKSYTRSKYAVATILVVASLSCSGCFTSRRADGYVLIGERIIIVEPGTKIDVPPLVPPAKKWYLVDNVGLLGWLGIPTPTDNGQ